MENHNSKHPVSTKCQRCGKSIPVQSAIEEDGLLLCGDCLITDVKHEVASAEIAAEEKRRHQRDLQHLTLQRQQKRRALFICCVCVAGLVLALCLVHINKSEPVANHKVVATENLEITRSVIVMAIHAYQNKHDGVPPDNLEELVPKYARANMVPVFENFTYQVLEKNTYLLKITTGEKTEMDAQENQNTIPAGNIL